MTMNLHHSPIARNASAVTLTHGNRIGSPASEDAIENILALGRARVIAPGTTIHRAGDLFRSVFYVRSGAMKRTLIQEDGREQVLGFPFPGDLLGLEAIDGGTHSTTVVTLDMCSVVEISYEAIEALAFEQPTVARFLYQRMSAALRDEHGWLAALGLLNADERVAAFLLDLSQRFSARGFSATRFMLRMTRAEIGSFLGLTLETVSRVLSRFQNHGLIRVTRRDVELLDLAALASLTTARVAHKTTHALN
jgi:CRP/FNR family transcriptional regulator, anaerobic regulatory protein